MFRTLRVGDETAIRWYLENASKDQPHNPSGRRSDGYVRMYDELKRTEGDNPTIGILLCEDTDEDMARYSVLHDNDHLFASKYMLYMPSPEQLRAEMNVRKPYFI